jgi:hypothetical protein
MTLSKPKTGPLPPWLPLKIPLRANRAPDRDRILMPDVSSV